MQRRHRKTFEQEISEAKEHVREIQSRASDNDTYAVIAFSERGFDLDSIIPRVTCLTFEAWKAFGRHVSKGAKAVAVPTWKPRYRKNDSGEWQQVTRTTKDGEEKPALVPTTAYLFHISQTEPYERAHADFWQLTPEMSAALRQNAPAPRDECATEPAAML